MPFPSPTLFPYSGLFPGDFADPLQQLNIDLPTPMVLDGHVTTLTLEGNETEMGIDGD